MTFVEPEPALSLLLLLGFGNGGDIFGLSAFVDDALRRLPLLVELLMAAGIFIRRIENRLFEKRIIQLVLLPIRTL